MAGSDRRPLVLLVDDTSEHLEPYALMFGEEGFRVQLAASAAEGLRCALGEPPAVIIVDLHMPGVDGFGFMRALLSNPRTHAVPRVVLTADSRDTIRFRVEQDFKPAAYCVKPCPPDELLAVVQSVLATPGQPG